MRVNVTDNGNVIHVQEAPHKPKIADTFTKQIVRPMVVGRNDEAPALNLLPIVFLYFPALDELQQVVADPFRLTFLNFNRDSFILIVEPKGPLTGWYAAGARSGSHPWRWKLTVLNWMGRVEDCRARVALLLVPDTRLSLQREVRRRQRLGVLAG